MRILIKNGYLPGDNITKNDICIDKSKVSYIGKVKKKEEKDFDKVIDAQGKYIIPGLVDIHSHLREPGFEYKETITTGTGAAAAGGFTDIACMPNTNPVIDSKYMVSYLKHKLSEDALVNVHIIGAVTKGQLGNELCDFEAMAGEGAIAFSDDGRPVMSADIMRKAAIEASKYNLPVISHCEDLTMLNEGQLHESEISSQLKVNGITPLAEEVMVAREIAIAQSLGIHIHLAHISTKNSVQLIRDAKKRGVKITAETCPHYFSLSCEEALSCSSYAKVNPPLREDDDIKAVIEGLMDGTLDCIATDHAPHSKEDKETDFNKAANGISGFETALAVSYTYLVANNHLTINKLSKLMTHNPASIINLKRGDIEVGLKANLIVFDNNTNWTVDASKFISKGHNTPFNNKPLQGKVTHTIVNGKLVYNNIIM